MTSNLRPAILLAPLLVLAGCLPYSCKREPPTELFPADSLSRQLAEATAIDTLDLAWVAEVEAEEAYPRTILWGPDGDLYLSDGQGGRVFAVDAAGERVRLVADGFEAPFLAGFRGDTLVVFSPETQALAFLHGGAVARRVRTPADLPGRGRLQYAAVAGDAVYVKLLGQDFPNYLARLDATTGALRDSIPLPGPYWRRAGLLRARGDTLLSLSGFRPVVDVLAPGAERLDTLALQGFDSPKLAASRAYMTGEAREPALLTAAAAPAGDLLFVLNMRPGWLRIDAYDAEGRLQRILIQPDPGYAHFFFPQDLAARRRPDGTYEIAVALTRPTPQVHLYRWPGP